MFLFININNITLFKFSQDVSAIGRIGLRTSEPSEATTPALNVGWQEAVDKKSIFSLLSWHTRVSKFEGRDEEMQELKAWAEADIPVWAKFVVAEGGAGKSRLGAEFAEQMQAEGWAAGFLDLREPQDFQMNEKGTLLIIDYPEDQIKNVTELLTDLTKLQPSSKIRVLLLTRQSLASWDSVIGASKSRNLVDIQNPIHLNPLDSESATAIFNSTADRALKLLESEVTSEAGEAGIDEKAMAAWLGQSAENSRALFIMAAAVHSADKPAEEIVKYSGRDVIDALVTRELDRWESTALAKSFESRYALARLWAMATIASTLSLERIKELIDSGLPIGIKSSDGLAEQLSTTGMLTNSKVHAPKPDIVAAAFLAKVFGQDIDSAPELLWAALEPDIKGGLDRIGRISYDAEVQLGIHDLRISDWLVKAAEGNIDRCIALSDLLTASSLALGLRKVRVVVWSLLAESTTKERGQAGYLNNLANALGDIGRHDDANKAIEDSVAIYRRLAKESASVNDPELARSLINLSSCYSYVGERESALQAAEESVAIYRRLAKESPSVYEPDLAMSLNNLSNRLRDNGDKQLALEAIQGAVKGYRRLAKESQAVYEPVLALSLNNLSTCFSYVGERDSALQAIEESVEIRRRLANESPAVYEHVLAMSLNNLSTCYSDVGERDAALKAIGEAVGIYRGLANENPAVFEPELSRGLTVRGRVLTGLGKISNGIKSYKEAIVIIRPYAKQLPKSQWADLLNYADSNLVKAEKMLKGE